MISVAEIQRDRAEDSRRGIMNSGTLKSDRVITGLDLNLSPISRVSAGFYSKKSHYGRIVENELLKRAAKSLFF